MRKSNSKEVKTLVRKYIKDCLEVSVIEFIEQFKTEFYNNPYHKKLGKQNAMAEYLKGLPTNTSFDFATYDIINIVAEWMDCTETEKQKFEHRSEDLFYRLISREMFYLYSKELKN